MGYKSLCVSTVNTTACLPKLGRNEAVCSSQAASRLRKFAIEDLEIRDRKSRGKHTQKKIGGSKLTISFD